MNEERQAEYLPPPMEEVPEVDFPLLRVTTPLEQLADLFHQLAAIQDKAVLWAEKTVIDSPRSRDEARDLRKGIYSTIKGIEERRLLVMKPVRDYDAEVKRVCDEVTAPLKAALKMIDDKGVAYAEKCKREEEEAKARAAAALAEAQRKAEAAERERRAEEDRRRIEEAERVRKAQLEAEAKAKAEGSNELAAKLKAEEAARAETARVQREQAERDRLAEEERARQKAEEDAARAKFASDMAKATGTGKTKGVKKIWVIEIVDEAKIPSKFKTYDPKKARKFCEAGLATETDPLKIIPGLRCYTTLTATGG